ncbi:MAG: D-alanyl-D-alanine carboxypeptidase/D-alanyl-D-alanine-endopeptidase [Pseudomonadota bacterium]
MPTLRAPCLPWLRACALAVTIAGSLAGPTGAHAQLPPDVSAALARAKLPPDAVTLVVADVDGKAAPRLSHRAGVAVNPASVMKLVTSFAALEQLGPAFTWSTPVFMDGTLQAGTLQGNLYIKGQGDPKLVVERLWLLLRRVQGLGISQITGDIVLDHSAFATVPQDPASFDGEPLRPYNAAPDALLVNYKSVVMSFTPDRSANVAQVAFEPPLAGVQMQATVPLAAVDCADYRAALKADFSDATRIRFTGSYPATCGERVWPVAYADPGSYAARAIEGMWRHLGGKLGGKVRDGSVPAGLTPVLEAVSPTLAEVVRDINKYSNNVMAQQMFLTLSLQQKGTGTPEGSRDAIGRWWQARIGGDAPVLDNGSGLSRSERITAAALARLLQAAWASPLMPELVSSLPITGVDGTLRRSRAKAAGAAHLKTGSLRDVAGVAGYVHGASGRRYVLVAIANHPNAGAVRPAIDALIDWAAKDN